MTTIQGLGSTTFSPLGFPFPATIVQKVTLSYPLPSGQRHLGGRLLRKARLRKKQMKYRFANQYSFMFNSVVQNVERTDENGQCFIEQTHIMTEIS